MKRKFRVVDVNLSVFVPEKIAKGDKDSLADYLTFQLYNRPEFFESFTANDLVVTNNTVKGEYDV
jgi:hypothetical protein